MSSNIRKFIFQQVASKNLSIEDSKELLEELDSLSKSLKEDIAIIGMSGRFPKADNLKEYWNNLINGINCTGSLNENRRDDLDILLNDYEKSLDDPYQIQGYLNDISCFDAEFFNISPKEAKIMEPCQRLLLEVIWEAIEDSGYCKSKISNSKTGVFIGRAHLGEVTYKDIFKYYDTNNFLGNMSGILSSRISYILNLKGPSLVVDTACSSGLFGVRMACESINAGECDMAVAGGICLNILPTVTRNIQILESPDSNLRPFDKNSNGTVWGEGVAAIMLKPLSKAKADNDNIYAVIKGSASNNDGASNGIAAPDAKAQEELLKSAFKDADINPRSISYIEAHGTGTKLGDPIEIKGLTNAFRYFTNDKQFCALGTVKGNIGHTVATSGLAGLIKVILALKHEVIPPMINFNESNPYIDFSNSPVFINDSLRQWKKSDSPRRAGISSFGLSGTNCHVILQEASGKEKDFYSTDELKFITLSAKKESALTKVIDRLIEYLEEDNSDNINDICYAYQTCRDHYKDRISIKLKSKEDLLEKLKFLKDGDISNEDIYSYNKISESEALNYDYEDVCNVLEEFVKSNKCDELLLNNILSLYVSGKDIEWDKLYKNEIRKKISIPTYPFEHTKYWPKNEEMSINSALLVPGMEENSSDKKDNISLEGKAQSNQYTDLEIKLGDIWGEVLGFEKLNINDDFYMLGGDSISMMKIINKIKNELNIEIKLNDFISNGTIAKLAEYISGVDINDKENIYTLIIPDKNNLNEEFPLTEVQLAYFLGRDNKLEMGGVSTHVYMEFETELDMTRLSLAMQKVIERHPMLRAIVLKSGKQIILNDVPKYEIKVDDISSLDKTEKDLRINNRRQELSHHVFQTDKWPLFNFEAFKISDAKYWLFCEVDMLIADGSSLQIFGKEMMQYYNNPDLVLDELEVSFRDYVLVHEEFKKSNTYLEDKKYWMDKIEGFPSAPKLPMKIVAENITKPKFKRKQKIVSEEKWNDIKQIARKYHVTPSALLCTIYGKVLSFWSNQSNMAINLTVFNRYPFHPDINKIIGDFTSIILLDINIDSKRSFFDNVADVQNKLVEALEHRHFDGVEFIREYAKHNNINKKAIMPIVFTSMLAKEDEDIRLNLGELKNGISQTPQVYLDFQATELSGALSITWDYVEEIFYEKVIDSMFNQFIELLEGLLINEEKIDIVHPKWSSNLISNYNDTDRKFEYSTLTDLVLDQIKRTPNNIAVEYKGRTITYDELNKKSNKVAYYLREKGLRDNELIGVLADRSINTIINIIAILKAGAAYIPIDPLYPEERKKYIIENSSSRFLIEPDIYEKEDIDKYPEDDIAVISKPNDIAYIIYTSGSTGKPKGVVITQDAAANTICDIIDRFNIGGQDKILSISSLCFDLSVFDLFGALSTGASLVLINDIRDIKDLSRELIEKKITIWNSVPAIMDLVLNNLDNDYINYDLRLVMLSGDWIPLRLPDRIKYQFPTSEVISLGGATEASIWSIYYPITQVKNEWKSIPYGKPLSNQKFYAMDENMKLCPVNTPGELFIGGKGVAKEYYNDEEKTKNSFINHSEVGRIYKTGDYGVLHEDGNIEFLGRKDNQIKIRGFRIELSEIECRLLEIDWIKDVVVNCSIEENREYICAYIISNDSNNEDFEGLREKLKDKLPEYMIPSYFIKLDSFPLNINGKVDRKKLPRPDLNELTAKSDYIAPRNDIENKLVKIWQEVLGVNANSIGINDNFFNLGGDSVRIMKIQSKLDEYFPGKVEVADLFVNQTIASLAKYIGEEDENDIAEENLDEKLFNMFDELEKGELDINEALENLNN